MTAIDFDVKVSFYVGSDADRRFPKPGGGRMETAAVQHVSELLAGLPSNWKCWGPEDEVGSHNFLSPDVVLRSVGSVRQGKVLTLQVKMANPGVIQSGLDAAQLSA